MANIIESRVTLEDEVFEETIDTMEEPIEVVRPSSYNDLEDLPQVNGVTLMGNKTSEELGIVTATDIENAVSAEATLRENADTALGGRIDGEKTARENADTALGGRIDGEITNRTNADNALGTRIDNEILARQGGDNNLQTQIDAITSKSDVVDVVADYAALQAYDTQHLGNNDVIKVLDDETHNDAQTYYRWDKTAGTWSYIGSEAPYYSKGQIDQQMQAKQDKLTAGTGISLDGATISADTTVLATKDDLEPEIVADLPAVGDTTKLYLTPTNKTASGNPITIDLKEDVGQITSFRLDGDTYQQTYTGKNLLVYPYHDTTKTVDGITCTDNGDGSVTVNGTLTENEVIFWLTKQIWSYSTENIVVPAGTYTISPTGDQHVYLYVSAYGETQGLITSTHATTGPATFTVPEKASLTIRISVKPQGTSVNNLVIKTQLESGSTSTDYEPFVGGQPSPSPDYPQPIQTVTGEQTVSINGTDYPISLGSIELCKLGTYQDYIYKDGSDWKVHKAIGSMTADGNTQIEPGSFGRYSYQFVVSEMRYSGIGNIPAVVAAPFYPIPYNDRTLELSYSVFAANKSANVPVIYIRNTNWTSSNALSSWFASNPTKFRYILYAPTDTTITDQTLITQLEAIRTASLQNGANTITNSATGSNLAGDMEISYYGYNPTNRYDKFIWLDLNNNYEQIGS